MRIFVCHAGSLRAGFRASWRPVAVGDGFPVREEKGDCFQFRASYLFALIAGFRPRQVCDVPLIAGARSSLSCEEASFGMS